MAIVSGDIKWHLSTTAGSAGDSLTQADPNASLGKYVATTEASATVNSLFDVITGPENAASTVDYRLVFVRNTHGSLTLLTSRVWLSGDVSGGAVVAIGLDTTAKSDADSASAQALTIANENTAPAGVSFSAPSDYAGGLVVGDLAPDEVKGIWIRRTAASTAALNNDGTTLNCQGDTGA